MTAKPTGCGFDPHSRRWNIYLNLYFEYITIYLILVSRLTVALSSATQHAMCPEFGRKWETECLNTRFPLPTEMYARYSVKLVYFDLINSIISFQLIIRSNYLWVSEMVTIWVNCTIQAYKNFYVAWWDVWLSDMSAWTVSKRHSFKYVNNFIRFQKISKFSYIKCSASDFLYIF